MKFTSLTLSVLASAVYALPTLSDLDDGNFIVTLNDDTDLDDHLSKLGGLLGGSDSVTHKYDNVFKGYAGSFSKTLFQSLSGILDGHIANIEKDSISYALDLEPGCMYKFFQLIMTLSNGIQLHLGDLNVSANARNSQKTLTCVL